MILDHSCDAIYFMHRRSTLNSLYFYNGRLPYAEKVMLPEPAGRETDSSCREIAQEWDPLCLYIWLRVLFQMHWRDKACILYSIRNCIKKQRSISADTDGTIWDGKGVVADSYTCLHGFLFTRKTEFAFESRSHCRHNLSS